MYEVANKFSWCLKKKSKILMYAYANIGDVVIYLHHLVLPPTKNTLIDHINGNGLDNQRINLRIATNSQNLANRGLNKNNSSGYKGVSFNKRKNQWRAYITCKGICKHLGYYTSKERAAKEYNRVAFEAFGEFAKLNTIE